MASAAPNKTLIGRMFARKSIAQVQQESASSELKRTLGKWNLLLLGVGWVLDRLFIEVDESAVATGGVA